MANANSGNNIPKIKVFESPETRKRTGAARGASHCIFSACLVLAIMFAIYAFRGYAPFGPNSLATMDANIQYLDFFAYYKHVLAGDAGFGFSFDKTLGGNMIGAFGYYMASPFNLLVGFFQTSQLHAFFDLIVALKLAAAAAFTTAFLRKRFLGGRQMDIWHYVAVTALSACYALGQYSLAQASNVMWLDGVYMLPLILMGVYKLVREKKAVQLSIAVACSILFNWYSAGINCLFAIFWFFAETALFISEDASGLKDGLKKFFSSLIRYGFSMAVGVLISGALFLPVIMAMQKGDRSALDFEKLLDTTFIGNMLSSVSGYVPGAQSSLGIVSLYCGSLPLIGAIGFFMSGKTGAKKKLICALMLLYALLLFYWNPLYWLYSLLTQVKSYWYRFSYVGIMTLVFIAADYLLLADASDIKKKAMPAVALYAVALLLHNYSKNTPNLDVIARAVLFSGVTGLTIVICAGRLNIKAEQLNKVTALFCAAAMLLFSVDIAYGARWQMHNYSVNSVKEHADYVRGAEEQIGMVKERDGSLYRITQTSTRHQNSNNLTANYDEALAYDYMSVSGYTSTPESNQLVFLDKLGYHRVSPSFVVTNTSVLGADSLLGVKYVLSGYPINGLVRLDELGEYNGKAVYENPFALPMAFTYSEGQKYDLAETKNPFEYQNALYSELIGEDAKLYVPLDYSAFTDEAGVLTYNVTIPAGDYAVYGNLPWNRWYDGRIDVDGGFITAYARWLTPSVFYMPVSSQDKTANCTVTVSAENRLESNGKEQFYALDLERFAAVTAMLQDNEVSMVEFSGGTARVEAEGRKGEKLFISIAYDDDWTVELNGHDVEPELLGGCMYVIPLEDGTNTIEMKYHVAGLLPGAACSCFGILMLAVYQLIYRRFRRKYDAA